MQHNCLVIIRFSTDEIPDHDSIIVLYHDSIIELLATNASG